MSFPRYESYKNSGVEWLGDVPSHWDAQSVKHSFYIVGGATPKSDRDDFWDGEILWVTPADLSRITGTIISDAQRKITTEGLLSCGTTIVPTGSIILSTRAPIGSLAVTGAELCTNQGCKALVPHDDADSAFFAYLLSACTEQLNVRGKGTTFLELSGDALGSFEVPKPPMAEQLAIAAFLDRETAKIDALIEEQKKLIELLKEKRQAVISHAVTKGLDPNVPMKDSGVEWLGEVPAHWELKLLKRAFRSIDYGISDALDVEGEIAVLRMGNIVDGEVRLDDLKYVNGVDFALLLQAGDLLFNRTNSLDLIGKVGFFKGVTDTPVSFASYLVRLRVTDSTNSRYMSYLLNTPGILGEARANALIAIGQCNLNPTKYGGFRVALPPLSEAIHISTFLDEETSAFAKLIAEAEAAVTLLQERRSALISAAVTGKIDVRDRAHQQIAAE